MNKTIDPTVPTNKHALPVSSTTQYVPQTILSTDIKLRPHMSRRKACDGAGWYLLDEIGGALAVRQFDDLVEGYAGGLGAGFLAALAKQLRSARHR
jgi:hypothetical protein